MNDDLDAAENGLKGGNSSFHKVSQSCLPSRLLQRLMDPSLMVSIRG